MNHWGQVLKDWDWKSGDFKRYGKKKDIRRCRYKRRKPKWYKSAKFVKGTQKIIRDGKVLQ